MVSLTARKGEFTRAEQESQIEFADDEVAGEESRGSTTLALRGFYPATSRLAPERRSITAFTATMIDDADISRADTSGRSDQPHSG